MYNCRNGDIMEVENNCMILLRLSSYGNSALQFFSCHNATGISQYLYAWLCFNNNCELDIPQTISWNMIITLY